MNNFRLLLLFYLVYCTNPKFGVCQQDPILVDGATAIFSILNYNVSDPAGESREFFYTVQPNTSATVKVTDIPGDAFFVIAQAHSYLHNVTLSTAIKTDVKTAVTGTNVGLWQSASTSTVNFYFKYFGDEGTTIVMFAVQAYGNQAPIPGGCNMEFAVDTSPFLQTSYTSDIITVDFAKASPPMSVLTWLGLQTDRSCDLKPFPVEHTMYRYFLPERDFSSDMYFFALQNLMTVGRIQKYAHVVPEKEGFRPLRRIFASYPGTGSSFVVVAYSTTASSVYVPSFTYCCDSLSEDNLCPSLTTTFSKVLSATILFLGLFACLVGHRFFRISLFLLGFLAGSLIMYTAMKNLSNVAESLLYSVIGGMITGIVCTIGWCFVSLPVFSVLLATSLLGYLVASILFFIILDHVDLFAVDLNFWCPLGVIVVAISWVILPLAEKAYIISLSILGSYAFIIPIDYYLGSNLRFILLNSIRRATVPEFKWAIIDAPYQSYDIFLTVSWISSVIIGIATQIMLTRNTAPFPPPLPIHRWYLRIRGPRVPTERTPLISS